ncbi:plastoquinol terminal oxidase [archaeon]|nr:MAG: plastoquinol terminal oxidase [archaeon]
MTSPSPQDLGLPQYIQDINRATVLAVKNFLGLVYKDRHYARFAALETIARVPYFSYTSVLHLYETLGWFRKKEYIQIHFAESWNELHHLLIMEALGGNSRRVDRLIATHIAFFYYWIVVVLYIINPSIAYNLNKQVELHAYETYNSFIESHGDELKTLPPPQIALDYYQNDPFMLKAFQYNLQHGGREDKANVTSIHQEVNSLYDVFCNIRADEAEHAETMGILQRDMALRSRGWKSED